MSGHCIKERSPSDRGAKHEAQIVFDFFFLFATFITESPAGRVPVTAPLLWSFCRLGPAYALCAIVVAPQKL